MWRYSPAKEKEAHLRPRVTEAKMFTAKIFLLLFFQQNRGHKATYVSGLASFTIADNREGK